MSKVIAIINQKGGVSKTTTAAAIGAGLTLRGYKVLLVDLDAQGNLSYSLGAEESNFTAIDVLTRKVKAAAVIQHLEQGDLLPTSPELALADKLLGDTGKEYRLKEALEPVKVNYDYIIIDTPPALGVLTVNALTACNGVIIPAQADVFSLQGISQLYETIWAVRQYTNPSLKVMGLLLTRYSGRAVLSKNIAGVMEQTAKYLNTKLFNKTIREGIAVKEAQISRQSIFEYAPKSNAAQDYSDFIDELLKEWEQ
jgi:chromosome partitioning protein